MGQFRKLIVHRRGAERTISRYSPSNRSLSSRRASLLSRRSCRSISWLMRFCSLASSDRQHAISAVTVAAPCGPVHHDDGGQWAAAASPLLPAALSTRRTHHHHHQRGQQQQTPRATPQWPAARRASPKTHRSCGCVSSLSNTTTLVVRHPPRKAATTGSTPSSVYNTSLEPVLPAVVPLVEPAWWRESRVGQSRWPVDIRRRDRWSREKNGTKASRTHTTHTHTLTHETRYPSMGDGRTHEKNDTSAHAHTYPREGSGREQKNANAIFSAFDSARENNIIYITRAHIIIYVCEWYIIIILYTTTCIIRECVRVCMCECVWVRRYLALGWGGRLAGARLGVVTAAAVCAR
jgi:hypothetical protein